MSAGGPRTGPLQRRIDGQATGTDREPTPEAATGRRGSLACVGVGMTLGSHLGPLARSYIEQADVVFVAVSDAIVERWIGGMNPDVRSLQPLYGDAKPRMQTYREMVAVILAEVRAGKRVVAAFYGHPGVFAWSPHQAIATARKEGYEAHMEPGISAEDCLYADLGIDPGEVGCQHFEASQMLYYKRRIDPTAYLILWQVAAIGGHGKARQNGHRQVLVDRLRADYPPRHRIIVYRAATLPIHPARIRRMQLQTLTTAALDMADTVVLPPARPLESDPRTLRRLARLERAAPA